VIVQIDDISVGMIVDAVTEVLTIGADHVDATKSISDNENGRFINGIGKIDDRLIIMLNLDEIIGLPGEAK
jgi:purine-binding chemotaxis protein CheW